MKDNYTCENKDCSYNDNEKCIQVGYQINGLSACPNYKRERKDADQIYATLFKGEENYNGGNSESDSCRKTED